MSDISEFRKVWQCVVVVWFARKSCGYFLEGKGKARRGRLTCVSSLIAGRFKDAGIPDGPGVKFDATTSTDHRPTTHLQHDIRY